MTRPTGEERSDTATSEPCTLTTSGIPRPRTARAPIGPFGTTQCTCTTSNAPLASNDRAERTAEATTSGASPYSGFLIVPPPSSDSEKPHGVHERRGE